MKYRNLKRQKRYLEDDDDDDIYFRFSNEDEESVKEFERLINFTDEDDYDE